MDKIKNIGEVSAMLSNVEQSKFQYDVEHSKSEYGQICYRHGYEDRDKEIVRCKDCKHLKRNWCLCEELPICGDDATTFEPDEDFYCKYGERKETK